MEITEGTETNLNGRATRGSSEMLLSLPAGCIELLQRCFPPEISL
jgi:hypothetical protein